MSLSTLNAYLGMLARHLPVTAGDMHTRFARSNAESADEDDDESLCGGRGGEKLTTKICATYRHRISANDGNKKSDQVKARKIWSH